MTERAAIRQPDDTHIGYGSVLPHADNRVVLAVGNEEIGARSKCRIACKLAIARFAFCGGQIDRLVQGGRSKMPNAGNVEYGSIVAEVNHRDAVGTRLANKQAPYRRKAED